MTAGTPTAYQQVSVNTADPSSLVVQLFDGALRFIARSRKALAAGDQPTFAYSLSRAHAIVAELSNVLDREAGGDVAHGLSALYDFSLRHLTEALITKSDRHLAEIAGILATLREAFDAARRG
jgi:flagellar protein FliS